MPVSPVPVPARVARQVKWILAFVALGGFVIAAAVAVAGLYVYRSQSFERQVMASITEVRSMADERSAFKADVQRRFAAGDFEGLDRMARELRDARTAYASGAWKLTDLYDTLAGLDDPYFDREGAIERTGEWLDRRPKSITARVALAEQWMGLAWGGRMRATGEPEDDDALAEFYDRLDLADEILRDGEGLEEGCPHESASWLRLMASQRWPRDMEEDYYDEAVAEEADYLPYHTLHLFYVDPSWQGEPGDTQRAADAIAKGPGGMARYARAIWSRCSRGQCAVNDISWPMLQRGFEELLALQPDSFEVKSAYCSFAVQFKDREQARRLLGQIGYRMETTVWRNRHQFVKAHRWATFDEDQGWSRLPGFGRLVP